MKRLKKRERRKKRRVKGKACKPDSFVSPPNDLKSICFSLTASLLRPPLRWGHPRSPHAPSPPPPCPSIVGDVDTRACARLAILSDRTVVFIFYLNVVLQRGLLFGGCCSFDSLLPHNTLCLSPIDAYATT